MWKSFGKFVPILITGLAACEQQPLAVDSTPNLSPNFSAAETQGSVLATIRAATTRYHRVDAALADGFFSDTPCIYNTPGARGLIYTNVARVNGVVDPAQPELLLYEPTKNGELRLVGVAFIVPSAAWDPFHISPPTLGDQTFVDRRTFPFGAPNPNYFLVVWAWRHNPNGMYQLYNPEVSCEFADASVVR